MIDRKETFENTQKHSNPRGGQQSSSSLFDWPDHSPEEPKVLETPLDRVDSFLTPTELFYVRSHHSPAPKLELASYRLHIDGAVRRPYSLTCKELRDMPSETCVGSVAILQECFDKLGRYGPRTFSRRSVQMAPI